MTLRPVPIWNHSQEERLKGVVGRSISESVKSLSAMAGITAMPATWGLFRGTKEPPVGLFNPAQGVYCVSMGIHGDILGSAFLCLSVPCTETIMDGMLKRIGASPDRLDSMVQSALEEVGNIFLNEFIKTLGNEVKLDILPATPRLEQGNWAKVWSQITSAQAHGGHDFIAIYGDFAGSFMQKLGHLFLCLSVDSWERLNQWATRGKALVVSVGLGAMEIATAPTVLKASDLGSCVALTLYDYQRRMGGMAHVMLPKSPSAEYAKDRPGKYSDTALDALLDKMRPSKNHVSIWLVGGSDMITPLISSFGSIGSQNADALKEEIKRKGLKLHGHDLGGTHARTVELMTETGELTIRSGHRMRKEDLR